jgi:hypothetical protein
MSNSIDYKQLKNNNSVNNINFNKPYFVEDDTYSNANKTSFRGSDN